MHETLINFEEFIVAEDLGDYFRVKSERAADYEKYFSQGRNAVQNFDGYTSANTEQLDLDQTVQLLLTLSEIKKVLETGNATDI